ncbi:MAG: DegT/DnrJ/EryC1/StrS family aminotransferase, partial [Schleiferiaceae bacterium]|nr:DegT/DnrJ/EryC1/StrS family aminotransferase [Schleiferiaceae bacterium]
MTIPHSLPSIDEKDIEAVVSVLRSKNLQDGALVGELEQMMTEWLKVPYAISTANGFGAIHLALLALDIQKGDEVIIPSYTCSALLHPISLVGAKPIITDIGKNSFNATLQSIKEKSSNRTRAIILPHTFGFPVNDIQAVKELGIPLREVCAQAIGGSLKGQKLGSIGDISIFSFYASKVVCGGDGGMLMTKDPELAKSARDYRSYNGIK